MSHLCSKYTLKERMIANKIGDASRNMSAARTPVTKAKWKKIKADLIKSLNGKYKLKFNSEEWTCCKVKEAKMSDGTSYAEHQPLCPCMTNRAVC